MGVNIINIILEVISYFVIIDYKVEVLMSILFNLVVDVLVFVFVKIDLKYLKNFDVIYKDIIVVFIYVYIDLYRVVIYNKGIMNGISVLMFVIGNDICLIEVGVYVYVLVSGKYILLIKWYVKDDFLVGEIKIFLVFGIVGGFMGILLKVKLLYKIFGVKNVMEFMKVVVCFGFV